jgi:hypothetical protein
MQDLAWKARIDVAVAGDDVDAGGRLKAEACSLWAVMAMESVAKADGPARMVSMTLELGPALCAAGMDIPVSAEVTKKTRSLAFVSARAEDDEGRMLFSATGMFGLSV